VAVAGGKNKHHAIKAALKGNYINVLITDLDTAKFLIK
jgi:DNA-binding transcriptional regulator LsrR (DeoR family)